MGEAGQYRPHRSTIMSEPIENGSNRNNKGQFVAGNTASKGNGRPKGVQSIPDILRKIGDEEGTADGVPKLEVVLRRVFNMALGFKDENGKRHNPEAWAIKFIADRTEGRALERVEQHVTKDEIIIE